jgi:hypothetical protein
LALDAELALKETAFGLRSGVSPEGEADMIVFSASVGVKDNRNIPASFFPIVAKSLQVAPT